MRMRSEQISERVNSEHEGNGVTSEQRLYKSCNQQRTPLVCTTGTRISSSQKHAEDKMELMVEKRNQTQIMVIVHGNVPEW
jgi:hypothetical protein